MYPHLDTKSQLKLSNTQRGGDTALIALCMKKSDFNPKINMHQQWAGAAKKLIHAVDRCCPNCGI